MAIDTSVGSAHWPRVTTDGRERVSRVAVRSAEERRDASLRNTPPVAQEQSPDPECWLDERLVVRDSPIEGRGLFFSEDVGGGTVVVKLGGEIVSTRRLQELIAAADADPNAPFVDTISVGDDAHLVLPSGSLVHYGNHSCEPTLWHVGPFEIATRRDVVAGEEATVDYGTQSGADGFAMACQCGSAKCRGEITSSDWRRRELQERYDGHWTPALQAWIDGLRGAAT